MVAVEHLCFPWRAPSPRAARIGASGRKSQRQERYAQEEPADDNQQKWLRRDEDAHPADLRVVWFAAHIEDCPDHEANDWDKG